MWGRGRKTDFVCFHGQLGMKLRSVVWMMGTRSSFQPFSGRESEDERLQELICERPRALGSCRAVLKSESVSHSVVLTLQPHGL